MEIVRVGLFFVKLQAREKIYSAKTSELIFEKITPENISYYLDLIASIRYICEYSVFKDRTRLLRVKEELSLVRSGILPPC